MLKDKKRWFIPHQQDNRSTQFEELKKCFVFLKILWKNKNQRNKAKRSIHTAAWAFCVTKHYLLYPSFFSAIHLKYPSMPFLFGLQPELDESTQAWNLSPLCQQMLQSNRRPNHLKERMTRNKYERKTNVKEHLFFMVSISVKEVTHMINFKKRTCLNLKHLLKNNFLFKTFHFNM